MYTHTSQISVINYIILTSIIIVSLHFFFYSAEWKTTRAIFVCHPAVPMSDNEALVNSEALNILPSTGKDPIRPWGWCYIIHLADRGLNSERPDPVPTSEKPRLAIARRRNALTSRCLAPIHSRS